MTRFTTNYIIITFHITDNVQANLFHTDINPPDYSIPGPSAIDCFLKNDANISDINGELFEWFFNIEGLFLHLCIFRYI